MTEFLSVYITTASKEEAEKISHSIVEKGLAACANIFPEVKSIFKWHGKTEYSAESVIIAKTAAEKYAALEARVKELHSYECPCIVAWPIAEGNKEYLKWIKLQTTGKEGNRAI